MGSEIIRVPLGFEHPKDTAGDFIPGAHLPILYNMPSEHRSGFQIYENVSEGTPVSPIFQTETAIEQWLLSKGYSHAAVQGFIQMGHAPMLVVGSDGNVVGGIEGMKHAKKDDTSA